MTEATTSNAPPAGGAAAPGATSATGQPSMLGGAPADGAPKLDMPTGFEGGADAWTKLDDAAKTASITASTEKQKAESAARVETFAKAEGKDAKLGAWNTLSPDEKAEAFKAMPDALKKELGIEDPAVPVYAAFKLPDGVSVDEKAMGEATALFKDARLTQEQGQKFIDLAIARETAAAKAGQQAYVDLQTKWVSEIKADPEIGGDKLTGAIAHASRAIDRLGGPDLKAALDLTGAGNNPVIVKAFVRMGRMISEDRFKAGNGAAPTAPQSPAQTIYGASGPKQSADT